VGSPIGGAGPPLASPSYGEATLAHYCHRPFAYIVIPKNLSRGGIRDRLCCLCRVENTRERKALRQAGIYLGNSFPKRGDRRHRHRHRTCRWISCRKNTGYHATDPKIRMQGAERGRSWIATKPRVIERTTHCRERRRALPRFRALVVR
jgi:hypothetical protein